MIKLVSAVRDVVHHHQGMLLMVPRPTGPWAMIGPGVPVDRLRGNRFGLRTSLDDTDALADLATPWFEVMLAWRTRRPFRRTREWQRLWGNPNRHRYPTREQLERTRGVVRQAMLRYERGSRGAE